MADKSTIILGPQAIGKILLALDYTSGESENIQNAVLQAIGLINPDTGVVLDIDADGHIGVTGTVAISSLPAGLASDAGLAAILDKLSSDPATQTTLAAILVKLADPSTQTTLAAVLAKLSSDPATQTTLAEVLAKLSADPATQTTLASVLEALNKFKFVGDALIAYGLARKAIVQGAGTYNATEILGYRVLVQGSGNWAETPIDGSGQSIPFAAQIVGNIHPEHLSAITVGTGGSALLYIPS